MRTVEDVKYMYSIKRVLKGNSFSTEIRILKNCLNLETFMKKLKICYLEGKYPENILQIIQCW